MTVVSSSMDPEDLTLTLVVEFGVGADRVWRLWSDPRTLERWWGPPGYPTVFARHDLVPGGESRWTMTVPGEPDRHGWWRVDVVDEPRRIEFVNGLADDDGEPVPGVAPYRCVVTIAAIATGTRMTMVLRFADAEQMRRLGDGMRDGLTAGLGQMDALVDQG